MSTVYMPGDKITMLPDELVQQFTLAEGDARPAGLAEGKRKFGDGNAVEPLDAEIVGEFPQIGFLVDDSGVEQVVDG
jgi:hypothetical protein